MISDEHLNYMYKKYEKLDVPRTCLTFSEYLELNK